MTAGVKSCQTNIPEFYVTDIIGHRRSCDPLEIFRTAAIPSKIYFATKSDSHQRLYFALRQFALFFLIVKDRKRNMGDRELSEDEVADLKEAFAMFDINGDGRCFVSAAAQSTMLS